MIRPLALALVLLAGPASAGACLSRADGKMDCNGVISIEWSNGYSYGATQTSGSPSNALPVQGEPPKFCEQGWVMVEVATGVDSIAALPGHATVKKCAPAGDLKDPK